MNDNLVDEAIDHKMFSVDILMSDVNYKFAVIQSEQSLKKDSIEDALSVYVEAITKEQGFKNQFNTHEMLLEIQSILESNEKVLSKHIIKNIKKNLDGVSDKFKYEVEHIKELMQVKKSEITSSQNSETDDYSQ